MRKKIFISAVVLFSFIPVYSQIVTMEYGEKDPGVKLVQIQNGLDNVQLFHVSEDAAYGVTDYGSLVKYDLETLKRTHVAKKYDLFKAKNKETYKVLHLGYTSSGILMVVQKKVRGGKDPNGIGYTTASSSYFKVTLDESLKIIPSSRTALFEDVNVQASNGKWPGIDVRRNKNFDSDSSFTVTVRTYGNTTVKRESWTNKSASTPSTSESFYANEDLEIIGKVEASPEIQIPEGIDIAALIKLAQSRMSSALVPISENSFGTLKLITEQQKCLGYSLGKAGSVPDETEVIAKGNFTDTETKNFNNQIAAKGSIKTIGTYPTSIKGNHYVVFAYQESRIRSTTSYSSGSGSVGYQTSSTYTWNESRVYKLLIFKISDYTSIDWHKTIFIRSQFNQNASTTWSPYESDKKALPDFVVDGKDNLVIISRSSPMEKKMEQFKRFNLEARSLSPDGTIEKQVLIGPKDNNLPFPVSTNGTKFTQQGKIRYYIGDLQKHQRTCLIKVTLNE